jgi:uncharacterized glyoxalase superfamily protein PhnB
MKTNRSIPPVTVVPMLVYPDVRAAVAWLTEAFGFAEQTRIGDSHRSQMSIGNDGAVIVVEASGDHVAPASGDHVAPATATATRAAAQITRVRVEDANAQYDRVLAAGARVLEPITDREYGERDFSVEDLAGHQWQFCETLRDVAPEDYGCTTVAPWPEH